MDGALDPSGRRSQKQVAGFSSREAAEAALAHALAAQGGGDPKTVAGFLERVWLPAKRGEVERSTFDQYAWAVRRHIVPELGAVKLSGLTPGLLSRWQVKLLAGDRLTGKARLGATSTRLVRKVLSMACEDAVERGLLSDNPVRGTQGPSPVGSDPRVWTAAQARRFLKCTAAHRLGVAFELLMMTGLRRGEVLGLRWSDIDLGAGRLRVSQQLVLEGGRPRLKSAESEGSQAVITVGSPMVGKLAAHRRRQDTERAAAAERWEELDLVFATPTGGWVGPERFADAMDEIIEIAGVPRITSNGLRRTGRALGRQLGPRARVDGPMAS